MRRGSGLTTKQMLNAPQKAIYVWCNRHLDYPKNLARKLGREDLEIVSQSFIDNGRWRGRVFGGIVLDHALELTERQEDEYKIMKGYIK